MKGLVAKLLLTYFRLLAKLQLKKNSRAKIIGVTGSSGKSTTHLATYLAIRKHFRVKRSKKANSESGIPLDILGLHPKNYTKLEWLKLTLMAPVKLLTNWEKFDIYLVEMGIDGPDEPKNMSYLLKIVQPDIGVFTNVTTSHAEPWDRLVPANQPNRVNKLKQLIAKEKGLILTTLPKTGWAVFNADDPLVLSIGFSSPAKQLAVGKSNQAQLKLVKVTTKLDQLNLLLSYQDQKSTLTINQALPSPDLAIDFALAVGVALALGIKLKDACQQLTNNYQPLPGRGKLLKGIKDSLILDFSYNAQPNSVIANLTQLSQVKTHARKVVVLGDMRELGRSSHYWHQQVARLAAKTANVMVLVGPQMKQFFIPEAKRLGFNLGQLHHFNNTYQAALFLKKNIKTGDLVFVQASQNTLLFEIIVKEILSNKENPDEVLARWRSPYFRKEREKIMS